jgi:hypothetical protein
MARTRENGEWRLYLRDHKWWWKWPIVLAIVALWGAAFALFIAPWQPSPSSIDDTATPTTTVADDDRSGDFVADEVPIGRDTDQPPDADGATDPDTTQDTMTVEELAADGDAVEQTEPTETEPTESEPTPARRSTRTDSPDAEPEPVVVEPVAAPTAPTTTRPRTATTTTTVRPAVNEPLPTFSTRRPTTPTTTTAPAPAPSPTTVAPTPVTTTTVAPPPPPTTVAPILPRLPSPHRPRSHRATPSNGGTVDRPAPERTTRG